MAAVYISKRKFRRAGKYLPPGMPLPELEGARPDVIDRLERMDMIEKVEEQKRRGRPPKEQEL